MSLRTKLTRNNNQRDAANKPSPDYLKHLDPKQIQSEFGNIGKHNLDVIGKHNLDVAELADRESKIQELTEPLELPWDHPNHWHHNKLRKVK